MWMAAVGIVLALVGTVGRSCQDYIHPLGYIVTTANAVSNSGTTIGPENSSDGVTTTVTYRWEGKVLTYSAVKSGAPEEEASSRRWIEPDGCTMIAESLFRKDKSKPWSKLRRTWIFDHK